MDKDSSKELAEEALFAGEAWFDPIEAGLRGRIRGRSRRVSNCATRQGRAPRHQAAQRPQLHGPELREVVGPCAQHDARRVLDLAAEHGAALLEGWRRFHG